MTLLARVFHIDISVCARCAGPVRVTRAVTTREDIAAELRGARPAPTAFASRSAVLVLARLTSLTPADTVLASAGAPGLVRPPLALERNFAALARE